MEDPLPLDDPMLPLGDPMRGRLRFLSSLARGTFGQVLLYYDEEYQEQVAIKFIDMSKTNSPSNVSLHSPEFPHCACSDSRGGPALARELWRAAERTISGGGL